MDATCIFHEKLLSQHFCFVCCICYKDLVIGQTHVTWDGLLEDICIDCFFYEAAAMHSHGELG